MVLITAAMMIYSTQGADTELHQGVEKILIRLTLFGINIGTFEMWNISIRLCKLTQPRFWEIMFFLKLMTSGVI